MLFKGYFKAALVLSFALTGTSAALPKTGSGTGPVCHMDSKPECPCREAAKKGRSQA